MPKRSRPAPPDNGDIFSRLIGLGERSVRKSYYPELQNRLEDLERFRSLLENISDVIFVVDLDDGSVADASGALWQVLRMGAEDVVGTPLEEILLAQTARDILEQLRSQERDAGVSLLHSGLRCADGIIRPAEIKAHVAEFGRRPYAVLVASDITERMRAEEQLKESEIRYRTVSEHNYDMECWRGPEGGMRYVSPSSERITGYPPERFLMDPSFLERLIHPEDRERWSTSMSCSDMHEEEGLDFRIRRADGEQRWVSQVCRDVVGPDGESLGVRFSIRDITSRKRMEEQLRHQALHDPLTALANRVLCLDRIRHAMRRADRREGYLYAVVFMDLDGFKVINQSLGHELGDGLLLEVGNRLLGSVRDVDTVARFGSDEFVLLLEELERPGEAVSIVQRVREALTRPLDIGGREFRLTASYGIVSVPQGESRPEDILQHANIAMHRAKDKGRDKLAVFSSGMLDQAVRRLDLENEMRRAIGAGEFVAWYQPIIDFGSGRVRGFEALVRWEHPQRGIVSPVEFIPLAEETGLIQELGLFVLREALDALAEWRRSPICDTDLFMSVNLSPRQFAHRELVRRIVDALEDSEVPPGALNLEITESAIMDDADLAIETIARLKRHGVTVSVDDFGTGYSSMSYLKRFSLDHLKIDLTFVRTIDTDPENLEIVKAIVSLAHSLNLSVVAEGVETERHSDILRALGCEYGQGYHFSRPVDRAAATRYLESKTCGPS